jgi:hypothetical protein
MPTYEATITVDAKILGQREPVTTNRQVPLSLEPASGSDGNGVLRLRDLLVQIVWQEVQDFTER